MKVIEKLEFADIVLQQLNNKKIEDQGNNIVIVDLDKL